MLLRLIVAATALAVTLMSQLIHTPGSGDEHAHAPLAVVVGTTDTPTSGESETAWPAGDVSAGAAAEPTVGWHTALVGDTDTAETPSGHHDTHGSVWGSVHAVVVILMLGVALLLRRAGWTSVLARAHAVALPAFGRSVAVPPPASVSVLDAGCLLRV